MKKLFQRRNFFIKKELQGKLIYHSFLLAFGGVIVFAAIFCFLAADNLTISYQNQHLQIGRTPLVLLREILTAHWLFLLSVGLFITINSLFLSHPTAPPNRGFTENSVLLPVVRRRKMSRFVVLVALVCGLTFPPGVRNSYAQELLTRRCRIQFEGDEELRQFNKRVSLGTFSFRFGKQDRVTVEEEVKRKVNLTLARVQEILDMFPRELKFEIFLLPSEKEVQAIYLEQFAQEVSFIAFYSPKTNAAYFSVQDIDMGVFAHELAHVVINHYFDNAPPVKIHELLAQYVESQMSNY
ncbi:MAG: hypothetical protein P8X63_12580 [Desulfuromonadaceae bacterium]